VDKRPSGEFVLRHIDSGRTTTVCGIDYIRFADLTVHREFLVRSNPGSPADPPADGDPPADDVVNVITPAELEAEVIDTGPADPPDDAAIALEPEEPVAEPTEVGPADPPDDAAIALEPEEPVAEPVEAKAVDLPDEAVVAPTSQPSSTALTGPPPGEDDSGFAVNDDGSLTITAAHFVAASDEDKPLRVVALSSPSRGRITDNGDETWTFTPDEAFDGEVSFDVILVDDEGEKSLARATIAIETADLATPSEMPELAQEEPPQLVRLRSTTRITADFVKPLIAALAGPVGNAFDIDLGAEARDLPLARRSISATGEFVTPLIAEAHFAPAPAAPEAEPAPKTDSDALVPQPEPGPDPAEAEPSKPEPDDEDKRLRELVDRLLERADDILAGDTKRPISRATAAPAARKPKPQARPEPARLSKDAGERPPAAQPKPSQADTPAKAGSPGRTSYRQVATFESFESFDW
jgi:hypothetical protein